MFNNLVYLITLKSNFYIIKLFIVDNPENIYIQS